MCRAAVVVLAVLAVAAVAEAGAPAPGVLQEIDTSTTTSRVQIKDVSTSRKSKQPDILSKIIPFLVMPFMMALMMLPLALTGMKFMLMKSIFLGKLAIFLSALNLLRRRLASQNSGLYSHNLHLQNREAWYQNESGSHDVAMQDDIIKAHYGYNGGEEVGAYWNKRRRRSLLR